jgi:4a-hydroxytetrahydrobiopterin dehydratase
MAIRSEKQDHHPEWFNVHRLVDVTLTTHDAGGISERDITWARAADAAFARHLSPTFQAGA